jgi:ribosomal protein S18 acetylase RimI-like enzyme
MIEKALNTDGLSILQVTAAIDIFNETEISCVEELWSAYRDEGEEASGYCFLVYRDAGRILGYACFGPHPLTQGSFDLYWIAVDPKARGRGIGRALLSRVESEVQARAGRLLLIETSSTPAYAPTRRFYEACGYPCIATVEDFYAPGDGLVMFAKRLPGHVPAGCTCSVSLDSHTVALLPTQSSHSSLLGSGDASSQLVCTISGYPEC